MGKFFIQPDSAAVLINKIWAVLAFLSIYAFPTSLMVYLYGKVVYKMKKSPSTSLSTVTSKVRDDQIEFFTNSPKFAIIGTTGFT